MTSAGLDGSNGVQLGLNITGTSGKGSKIDGPSNFIVKAQNDVPQTNEKAQNNNSQLNETGQIDTKAHNYVSQINEKVDGLIKIPPGYYT